MFGGHLSPWMGNFNIQRISPAEGASSVPFAAIYYEAMASPYGCLSALNFFSATLIYYTPGT